MGMDYSKASQGILREDCFDKENLGKCESVMCLGNGYMGLRSVTEEHYLNESRGCFVAGTFNKFDEQEVTELPNAADVTGMDIFLDGVRFSLADGITEEYARELDLNTGELTRDIVWEAPGKAGKVKLVFKRIVSLKRLHVIAQTAEITPLSGEMQIKLHSGIDGRVTNTGSQHFSEGEKRFYDKRYIQSVQTTTQSGIDFISTVTHRVLLDGKESEAEADVFIDRRKIYAGYEVKAACGSTLRVEKYANLYTSRDKDMEGKTEKEIQEISLNACKEECQAGYQTLLRESAKQWKEEVWDAVPIQIKGTGEKAVMDQFAVRFAQYHLRLMVPSHDNRMNIGAKALTGEGYKGHTFWDTEIFLLPYYTFTMPQAARKLEEYRYLSLPGAHDKAEHNGYRGAMFPWESAWLDDGEVTPEYCGVDVVTGMPLKVWSGFIEQHITADVAYGAWQYATITGDKGYLEDCGYELIMDSAKFWASRLEKGSADGKYHINDVVGPDEFREHVNDNAFTNYMAHWNMAKALQYARELKQNQPQLYRRLDEKLDLAALCAEWEDCCKNIYLPKPNESNVLPQDDRYLQCRDVDLSKYKQQEHVGGIMRDYNMEQINQIQVSKQADALVLFFLLENEFSQEVKMASWEYYEKRTIHDSSLSLSTHAVLACDMGEKDMAYSLFQKASMIDLGPFMGSSDTGVHAASFGGVWQCVVYGFGGVRMLDGKLRMNPSLPDAWEQLAFTLIWKGQKLAVDISRETITIQNLTQTETVSIEIAGEMYELADGLTVSY